MTTDHVLTPPCSGPAFRDAVNWPDGEVRGASSRTKRSCPPRPKREQALTTLTRRTSIVTRAVRIMVLETPLCGSWCWIPFYAHDTPVRCEHDLALPAPGDADVVRIGLA